VEPEEGSAVGAGARHYVQQDLPQGDRTARDGAKNHYCIVARVRTESQIESETESRCHEASPLQDAQGARKMIIGELIGKGESEGGAYGKKSKSTKAH
jgi:hypothetical protein